MPENVYRRHPLLEIVDHPVAFTSEEQILANREEILQHDISDAEELSHESSSGGKSSMAASIFNLVNNVAGAGILTLSSGVAKGTGWVPALLICAGLGALSSHTFTLIGEACSLTDEVNFKGLWSSTMGEETAYLVDAIVAVMCFACSIIYQGILGDVFSPILNSTGLKVLSKGRTSTILAITVAILFPLSLIQNLSALAFTSTLGFASVTYTVFFVLFRALDGTYTPKMGRFVMDKIIDMPSFARSTPLKINFASLVLASNLGLAFVAHYNGPCFYRELKENSPKRFRKMVHTSFALLTSLYVTIMLSGFFTFGDSTKGNLLLNYHPNDRLAVLGNLATGFSILFGFPLVMRGVVEGMDGILSKIGIDPSVLQMEKVKIVSLLLVVMTLIAISVDDVSLIVSLTGAACGSFLVFILPVLIYVKAVKMKFGENSIEHRRSKLNYSASFLGGILGTLGVAMAIKDIVL